MELLIPGAIAVTLALPLPAFGGEYTPSLTRIRTGLERPPTSSLQTGPPAAENVIRTAVGEDDKTVAQRRGSRERIRSGPDPVWNGLLIGAGIGAGGGYLWARDVCGSNDAECFAIAGPVGVLSGTGIGAAVGAIVDALTR